MLVQLFVGRRQLRNLPLQLRDQPHQLVALRGREVLGLAHIQSIKLVQYPTTPLPTPIPLINYIMKITHTIRRSPQYIMGELDFVSYLKSQGVPTSSAIPSTEGQLIETIDGEKGMFLAYVFEKAQGMLVGRKNWNPGLFHNLGRLMGRIHSLSKDFEPSNESFRRQQWHEDETLKIEKYVPRSLSEDSFLETKTATQ